jgi:hypothetical protein
MLEVPIGISGTEANTDQSKPSVRRGETGSMNFMATKRAWLFLVLWLAFVALGAYTWDRFLRPLFRN